MRARPGSSTRRGRGRGTGGNSLGNSILLLVERDEADRLLEQPHQAEHNQQKRERLHCQTGAPKECQLDSWRMSASAQGAHGAAHGRVSSEASATDWDALIEQ